MEQGKKKKKKRKKKRKRKGSINNISRAIWSPPFQSMVSSRNSLAFLGFISQNLSLGS